MALTSGKHSIAYLHSPQRNGDTTYVIWLSTYCRWQRVFFVEFVIIILKIHRVLIFYSWPQLPCQWKQMLSYRAIDKDALARMKLKYLASYPSNFTCWLCIFCTSEQIQLKETTFKVITNLLLTTTNNVYIRQILWLVNNVKLKNSLN